MRKQQMELCIMKLVKTVITEYNLVWFRRGAFVFSERYINARRGLSKMDRCFDCGRKFQIDESFNLVHFKGRLNSVFCSACLNKLAEGIPETQKFYHINNPTGKNFERYD